ncbi:TPA: hypothetical protein PIJ69_002674 [Staphylococcus aureus]|nr:hypothetical protein [Staphylococcus aureus]HDE6817898.1 hypothetical protein [Staphylococcus aureus]HDE8073856.1 hypothetical protein [Staphylococcus aureus]HDE8958167.1 hypothetical protein [Staphylococcus aureus]HDE8960873.1 hypothetical protein [Staphylococcus aureus]
MKIKVKKEMNLPELIQWAWKNPELTTGKRFCTENKDNEKFIYFSWEDGRKCFTSYFITPEDTFVVEVEEEITEDTVFDRLFEVYEFLEGGYNSTLYANASINERLNDTFFFVKAFYILNDDLTMTLIWKDEELVV